jgi:hypothetical protein
MPLNDDPALLRRPLGFAVRINRAENLDVDATRQRLPGLLKFARTFIAEILEKEFDTLIVGFPVPARARAAGLTARLKREDPNSLAALLLAPFPHVSGVVSVPHVRGRDGQGWLV